MSYREREERWEIREVRFVSMCAVLWGVVLVLIGAAALLPHDLSRYVWPIVAIGAGAWLLFGPLYWYWERPYDRYDELADWE